MDDFLRGSLDHLEIQPSQSVWKSISKRLLILEFARLNFTNIGKSWLYSGIALVATIGGFAYLSLHSEELPLNMDPLPKTNHITTIDSEQKEQTTIELSEVHEIQKVSEQTNDRDHLEQVAGKEVQMENESSNLKMHQPKETAAIIEAKKTSPDLIIETIETINEGNSESMPAVREEIQLNKIPSNHDTKSILNSYSYNSKKLDKNLSAPKEDDHRTNNEKPKKNRINNGGFSKKLQDLNSPIENTNPGLNWYVSPSYMPEWSFSSDDIYVINHQFTIAGGISLGKFDVNIGLGYRSEKTPSLFHTSFQSYDSVGFYYDIDYYEINPVNQDTIILHYTIQNIYDSVDHESETKGPDQKRRWVYIPIKLGYQLFASSSYELYGKISGTIGWEYFTEEIELTNPNIPTYQQTNITPNSQSPYFQIGIGLENNFNLMQNWWIYAEPRINYYLKSPYVIEGGKNNGPLGFGIQLGIKYQFKGRR
ncbi:MAG: hypothetical protein GQ527_00500 [Bacteroidales bacterium]|nr:hypothetical protein [Bacteroidales bacterium]